MIKNDGGSGSGSDSGSGWMVGWMECCSIYIYIYISPHRHDDECFGTHQGNTCTIGSRQTCCPLMQSNRHHLKAKDSEIATEEHTHTHTHTHTYTVPGTRKPRPTSYSTIELREIT